MEAGDEQTRALNQIARGLVSALPSTGLSVGLALGPELGLALDPASISERCRNLAAGSEAGQRRDRHRSYRHSSVCKEAGRLAAGRLQVCVDRQTGASGESDGPTMPLIWHLIGATRSDEMRSGELLIWGANRLEARAWLGPVLRPDERPPQGCRRLLRKLASRAGRMGARKRPDSLEAALARVQRLLGD